MKFDPTEIEGAVVVRHDVHSDSRGRFRRLYCDREFAAAGLAPRWVQANHSVTLGRGTIRGLHFQHPPSAEAKLVSCTVGRAFDVAVDLRKGSPTFLRWTAIEIDETASFHIPQGCAHGFQALTDEVHLIYQHSAEYAPDHEGGVRFDDPAIGVEWPLPAGTVSDRDCSFALIDSRFEGLAL
jgi:dTDP-4-dehydrorhamnose 3,5-epimerase